MEGRNDVLGRFQALEQAVTAVLSRILQSSESEASLKSLFTEQEWNQKLALKDKILSTLATGAAESAMETLNEWMTHNDVKHIMAALDERQLNSVMSEQGIKCTNTPNPTLPNATLVEVSASCKKIELQKLRGKLAEKKRTESELSAKVSAQMRAADALRSKLESFSKNAEDVFRMASDTTA